MKPCIGGLSLDKILVLAVTLAVVAMVITSTFVVPAEQYNKGNYADGDDKAVKYNG